MITTELMGGLGNQLFQMFNLISYCKDHNNIFVIEKHKILYGPIRNYNVYWDNIFKNIEKSHCKENKFNFPILKEPSFKYTKIQTIPLNQPVKFWGYFQSYKYFHHNIDYINKLLDIQGLKNIVSNKENIDYNNTISLHFRVGDYAKLQQYHPLMKPEYYIKSLNTLIEKTNKNDWNILYFFEEENEKYVIQQIDIIKKQFPYLTFTKCNHSLKDWEQMLQMSLCKHNIIANSSFSWWGAYLNNNNNTVCYPDIWFGPALKNHNTVDLFLDSWEKIII